MIIFPLFLAMIAAVVLGIFLHDWLAFIFNLDEEL